MGIGTITVVNKYSMPKALANDFHYYIGRPSALGNDFKMNNEQSRGRVVEQHKEQLSYQIKYNDPRICEALNEIVGQVQLDKDVKLVCYCAPKSCHGDNIKAAIEEALGISDAHAASIGL